MLVIVAPIVKSVGVFYFPYLCITMAKRLFLSQNYIVVDNDNSTPLKYFSKSLSFIRVTNENYQLYGGDGDETGYHSFLISDAENWFEESETIPYTSSTLLNFLLSNTSPSPQVNSSGTLLISDFNAEVSMGSYSGYLADTISGRNVDVDNNFSEDMWNGGFLYTGHNCVEAETLSVVSSSANDTGSLVSSGVATGGSSTTLIDSSADFVTDGVAVGDILINDTQLFHGIVSEVTSATTLTVHFFKDGNRKLPYFFSNDDSYRVATASSTGAAVTKLLGLDGDYNRQNEYVILNGTTGVTTTKDFIRQDKATIELAGSNGYNVGEITANQSVTTDNVTMVMPADSGQTACCCTTVPSGKRWVVNLLEFSIVRVNGSSGSAQVQFQVRERGSNAWQTKRFESVSTSFAYIEEITGGIVIEEQSDVKWRIQSASDNNTEATAIIGYVEIDK